MSTIEYGSMRITGLDSTAKRLRMLPLALASTRGGPVRGALFAATKLIRDEARKLAPVGKGTPLPGNLRRQIYAYRDRNPRSNGAVERYIISARTGRRKTTRRLRAFGAVGPQNKVKVIGGDAFYWRFVEFGTVKQKPQAFMRRAFEGHKVQAVRIFTVQLNRGIDRAVEKLRRQVS
jgi:HK97 gp10 family phage protein